MALLPLWIARDLIAAERVTQYQASPEVGRLRVMGLVSAIVGVAIVWLVRH